MKTQKGQKWIDSEGNEVPLYAISAVMRGEERWAKKMAAAALKAEKALAEVTNISREAYEDIYGLKLAEAKMKGTRENFASMSFNSFDGKVGVRITKPNVRTFDPTIASFIKEKFTEYFDSLNAENEMAVFLKGLINDLMFKSGGQLDYGKVIELRKYRSQLADNPKLAIKARPFIEAIDLFDKAVIVKRGNTGLFIEVDENGAKRKVALKYTDI
jgi:hypothetical protein